MAYLEFDRISWRGMSWICWNVWVAGLERCIPTLGRWVPFQFKTDRSRHDRPGADQKSSLVSVRAVGAVDVPLTCRGDDKETDSYDGLHDRDSVRSLFPLWSPLCVCVCRVSTELGSWNPVAW